MKPDERDRKILKGAVILGATYLIYKVFENKILRNIIGWGFCIFVIIHVIGYRKEERNNRKNPNSEEAIKFRKKYQIQEKTELQKEMDEQHKKPYDEDEYWNFEYRKN